MANVFEPVTYLHYKPLTSYATLTYLTCTIASYLYILQSATLHVLQPVIYTYMLQPVIYTFCSSVEYKSFQSEVEPGRLPPTKPSKGMIIAPAPVPSAIHRSSSLPRATPGSSITHFIHPVNQTDTHSTFITKRLVGFCCSNFFLLF